MDLRACFSALFSVRMDGIPARSLIKVLPPASKPTNSPEIESETERRKETERKREFKIKKGKRQRRVRESREQLRWSERDRQHV
jgi:hypothetical protein